MLVMEILKNTIGMHERIGSPALMERFMLRNGIARARGHIPANPSGLPRHCFMNALHYALAHDVKYVEGYAVRAELNILIHHAWCSSGEFAIDPTWNDPADCSYVGYEFTADEARRIALKNGVYGLFLPGVHIDVALLRKLDPEGVAADIARYAPQLATAL